MHGWMQRLEDSVEHRTWSLRALGEKSLFTAAGTLLYPVFVYYSTSVTFNIWITDCDFNVRCLRWCAGDWQVSVFFSPLFRRSLLKKIWQCRRSSSWSWTLLRKLRWDVTDSWKLYSRHSRYLRMDFTTAVFTFVLTESVREDGKHPGENKEVSFSAHCFF